MRYLVAAGLVASGAALAGSTAASDVYPWRNGTSLPAVSIADRFPPPPGFRRIAAAPGSFGHWLRHLPLKPAGTRVLLYDGRPKPLQSVHAAVIDIDTGGRDLQQCADAVMRLRAEYLFGAGRARDIHFDFTSGDWAAFARWSDGWRPQVDGNRVAWRRAAAPAADHAALGRYLTVVFTYAGTYSLRREMKSVNDIKDMMIGDVFIEGGFPGHAVLVVDMADDPAAGARRFMLAQSYTPAQDMHVLRNPADPEGGVWYRTDFGDVLETPEWRFRAGDLRRFR